MTLSSVHIHPYGDTQAQNHCSHSRKFVIFFKCGLNYVIVCQKQVIEVHVNSWSESRSPQPSVGVSFNP